MNSHSTLFWILFVVGCAVATLLSRLPPILWMGKKRLPLGLQQWLRYVPAAVLAAAIAPAVFMPAGQLHVSASNAYLLAAIPTSVAAVASRNLLLTMAVGMGCFLCIQ